MKSKQEKNIGRITVRLPAKHLVFLGSATGQNSDLVRQALELFIARQKGGEL